MVTRVTLLLSTGKGARPLCVRVVEPVLQNGRVGDSNGAHAHLTHHSVHEHCRRYGHHPHWYQHHGYYIYMLNQHQHQHQQQKPSWVSSESESAPPLLSQVLTSGRKPSVKLINTWKSTKQRKSRCVLSPKCIMAVGLTVQIKRKQKLPSLAQNLIKSDKNYRVWYKIW